LQWLYLRVYRLFGTVVLSILFEIIASINLITDLYL
jgi:hypothetical protein